MLIQHNQTRRHSVLVCRDTRAEGSAQHNVFGRLGSGGRISHPLHVAMFGSLSFREPKRGCNERVLASLVGS